MSVANLAGDSHLWLPRLWKTATPRRQLQAQSCQTWPSLVGFPIFLRCAPLCPGEEVTVTVSKSLEDVKEHRPSTADSAARQHEHELTLF